MACLVTIEEFEEALEALYKSHTSVAELVDALIEELGYDDDCLATLIDGVPKFMFLYTPPFEIKRFEEAWHDGRRIYTLKPYDEDGHKIDFRIFIGHDISTDEFFVLSILPRATCYDTSKPTYQQLCDRYDRTRIPSIRVR